MTLTPQEGVNCFERTSRKVGYNLPHLPHRGRGSRPSLDTLRYAVDSGRFCEVGGRGGGGSPEAGKGENSRTVKTSGLRTFSLSSVHRFLVGLSSSAFVPAIVLLFREYCDRLCTMPSI